MVVGEIVASVFADRLRGRSAFISASASLFVGLVALIAFVLTIGQSTTKDARPSGAPTNVNISGPFWITALSVIAVTIIVALVLFWNIRRQTLALESVELDLKRRESDAIEEATDRLKEKMELPNLVNLNRLVLDRYHGIATQQADSSFKSSRRAMWLGFAWLLGCFLVATLSPSSDRAQLLIGSLALIGGTLSAFLSRTYIRVYERSLLQLNRYFEQPLLNSYLLSAERVIGEMEVGRSEAYRAVLDRLLDVDKGSSPLDDRSKPSSVRSNNHRNQPKLSGVDEDVKSQTPSS